MGIQGLDFQPRPLPFVGGLNTKSNKQAKNPPALDICVDADFDETGGLITRKPYAAKDTVNGAGHYVDTNGGTITNFRKLAKFGDELLMFTKDALYSWSDKDTKWARRGEHLAMSVDEEIRFATNSDQTEVDRAELGGVVVFAWTENADGTLAATGAGGCLAAAYEAASGRVIMPPTEIPDAVGRCKLVALSTRIALFYEDGNPSLNVIMIDPADVVGTTTCATGLGEIVVLASPNFGKVYDACRVAGADTAVVVSRRVTTTSYTIATVVATTGTVTASTKARTLDRCCAVSSTPDGASAQVVRTSGTNIQGDLITISTLVDVYTAQAIGTVNTATVRQIAAAHRTVTDSGKYRCYVFWSFYDTTGPQYDETKSNWVDTGNTLGTQLRILAWCQVASRAFDRGGRVYYWAVFGNGDSFDVTFGPVQSVYVLVRDDGTIVASSRVGNAAIVASFTSFAVGHLPGVQATTGSDEYAWAGVYVRDVEAQLTRSFEARAPREITFAFDSDDARRTVEFGETLYVSGSPLLQYDGVSLTEVGFLVGPWHFIALAEGAGTGNLAAGTYAYKATLRAMNARGESERSSSFAIQTATCAALDKVDLNSGGGSTDFEGRTIWTTRKTRVAWEYWRTLKNPVDASPFYLVTSSSPATTVGSNRYLKNSTLFDITGAAITVGPFADNLADASIENGEENPEVGDVLDHVPPPSAKLLAATQTRLFLAGVAGSPDTVWYSKTRIAGQVASWNDVLSFDVPQEGGDITAIAFLNETLVVFRESAVYSFAGDGLDNNGNGSNYGPARTLSLDSGALSAEGVVVAGFGVMFKSSKGWYLLSRSFDVQYIGDKVKSYDGEDVLAADIAPSQQQIRIVTESRALIFDNFVGQWGEWSIADGIHAVVWRGVHVYLSSTAGAKQQRTDYVGVDYGVDVELAWDKLADLHGIGIVRLVQLLGEWHSLHRVRVRIARDYKSDGAGGWSYFYDKIWTPDATVVGGPERLQFGPSQNRMGAIKVRLTMKHITNDAPPDGQACTLTGLVLEAAVEKGTFTNLAAAAKQ